jgi:hypothetical protein
MTRARIVHRDPARRRQARLEHRAVLGLEGGEIGADQTDHLALRDLDADPRQHRRQPLRRHLPLNVRGQDEPPQVRPEAAEYTRRQRRDQRLAARRAPPGPPIERDLRRDDEIAHGDRMAALEARARGNVLQLQRHLAIHAPGVTLGPAPAPLRRAPDLAGLLLHARGARRLRRRPWRQPLQPRDFVPQRLNLRLQHDMGRPQLFVPGARTGVLRTQRLVPQTKAPDLADQIDDECAKLADRKRSSRIGCEGQHGQRDHHANAPSNHRRHKTCRLPSDRFEARLSSQGWAAGDAVGDQCYNIQNLDGSNFGDVL